MSAVIAFQPPGASVFGGRPIYREALAELVAMREWERQRDQDIRALLGRNFPENNLRIRLIYDIVIEHALGRSQIMTYYMLTAPDGASGRRVGTELHLLASVGLIELQRSRGDRRSKLVLPIAKLINRFNTIPSPMTQIPSKSAQNCEP